MAFAVHLIRLLPIALALAGVYVLGKRSRRRKAPGNNRGLTVSPLAGLVLGAMFSGFQAILQPESRHKVTEEQKEDDFGGDGGLEPPGGRRFHQQLRNIRQGAEVEELVVRTDHVPAPEDVRKQDRWGA
jgi:hypothetical protein